MSKKKDNKNLVKAIFEEKFYANLAKGFEEFKTKQSIDVIVKEVDLLDEFLVYGENKNTKILKQKKILLEPETSYLAFHAQVFKELSIIEKIISIVSFKTLLDVNHNKKPTAFELDDTTSSAIEYSYSENEKDYALKINPHKVDDESSYNLMYDVIVSVLKDDIHQSALKYIMDKNPSKKYPINVLANYVKYSPQPEGFDLYILGKGEHTKEKLKEYANFGNQPIELELRKVYDIVGSYMDISEDYLEMKDSFWLMDKTKIQAIHENLDKLFIKEIDEDKEEYYKDKLQEQIDTLNEKRTRYRGKVDNIKEQFENSRQ